MKVSDHFDLRELVSPEIYNRTNILDRAFDFINVNAPGTLEYIRSIFGSVTINTWHVGGNYKNSGLRSPDSSVGSKYSSHRFGCGFDLKFADSTPIDVYNYILSTPESFPFIRRMEDANKTVTWLHIEISTKPRQGDIYTFSP